MKKFTIGDITTPNRWNDHWWSIRVSDDTSVDMSTSTWDKRDYVIYRRKMLEPNNQKTHDQGFIECVSSLTHNLTEAFERLVELANREIDNGS